MNSAFKSKEFWNNIALISVVFLQIVKNLLLVVMLNLSLLYQDNI